MTSKMDKTQDDRAWASQSVICFEFSQEGGKWEVGAGVLIKLQNARPLRLFLWGHLTGVAQAYDCQFPWNESLGTEFIHWSRSVNNTRTEGTGGRASASWLENRAFQEQNQCHVSWERTNEVPLKWHLKQYFHHVSDLSQELETYLRTLWSLSVRVRAHVCIYISTRVRLPLPHSDLHLPWKTHTLPEILRDTSTPSTDDGLRDLMTFTARKFNLTVTTVTVPVLPTLHQALGHSPGPQTAHALVHLSRLESRTAELEFPPTLCIALAATRKKKDRGSLRLHQPQARLS